MSPAMRKNGNEGLRIVDAIGNTVVTNDKSSTMGALDQDDLLVY